MNHYITILDIIAALAMIGMAFLVYENSRFDNRTKGRFYMTYLIILLAMLAEWTGLCLNGGPEWTRTIHKIVKCLDYILTPAAGFMIIEQVSEKDVMRKVMGGLMVGNALLQILSIFTGSTFYLDENNVYHHGPMYMIYTAIYLLTLLALFVRFYLYGRNYRRHNRASLLLVTLVILLSVIFQEVLGYRVCYLMLSIAAILIFIHFSEFAQVTSDADLLRHKRLLTTDTLSGLDSRYSYNDDLKKYAENGTIPENLVVFSVDINELKATNDTWGHLAGDELIQGAALCIKNTLERYGKCYRTGGDEFIAFLHADAEKAYDLSKALNREAEKWSGALVQTLSLSVGYVVAREHQTAGIEDLIRMADEKMYEAKANFYMQSGKNRRRNDRRRAAIEQKQKEYMDIISSFASDVTGLYVIDKEKREVTAYRTSASDHRIRSGVPMDIGFEAAMDQFIDSRVHPDDKEPMRMNVQLDFISRELAEKKSFIYHFRTLINGEINYHYMKCIRNLEGEDYDKIIVSFCPEDNITVRKKVLESAGAIRNSRKTLLLVDKEDEESLRLRDMLEQEFICLETQTGKEALCILKEKRNDITAVLYREDIADINALQFLGEVDKDDDLEGIPVIVMSDSRQESAEKEYINAGATELFRRPYDFTILRHRLENVIKMKMVSDSLDEIETDDLTGLYTKQAFFYHARVLIDASPEESFTIVISDILNFKIYNTVYGESKGDELLQNLAQKIHKSVQSGIVARYGADQIIVIGKTPAGRDITWHVNRIQEYVNRELKENVTLKFGIYENVDHSLDIARMCDRALVALKASKGNFDSNYAKFDGPVSQQQLRGQFYESNFRSAIDNEEFVVWYQPKYSPYTEKIVGAEALVRWKTSEGGMLSPGEFLPVFEEDGLIRELDEYVFRKVCAEQKKWVDRNVKIIPISVNLSRNSMHQSNVVKRYKAIVEEYNISPACVPIEITESAAIGNEEIKPLADAFYEAGFSLHMDDFGSGKSSIAGLNYLHFDTVKLDRSLIEFIGNEDGNLVLMYTVALGKELGLHLVAEGVETVEQVKYLKDIGCEAIQGYYYSRPLPVEEFEKLVHEKKELDEAHFDPRYKFTATDSVVKRAMDRMLQRMPGGFFTYRSDDSVILSSNHYLWKMFGCETEAEFMEYVGGTFKGMVFEEDLQTVEEFIAQQIEKDSEEMDYVEYRILRKDGQKIPVVDYGHLDHQADGGIFYVFITEANKPYRM